MSGHTPGPWVVTPDSWVMSTSKPSLGIARVGTHLKNFPENARLIAAAPTLLLAVYVAHGMLERQLDSDGMGPDGWGDDEHEAFRVLKAAIAKAEGR